MLVTLSKSAWQLSQFSLQKMWKKILWWWAKNLFYNLKLNLCVISCNLFMWRLMLTLKAMRYFKDHSNNSNINAKELYHLNSSYFTVITTIVQLTLYNQFIYHVSHCVVGSAGCREGRACPASGAAVRPQSSSHWSRPQVRCTTGRQAA